MTCRREGDDGAGTVLVLAAVAVVTFTALAVLAATAVVAARDRAAVAADAAALGGAAQASLARSPCPAAAALATGNGAVLVGCRADGAIVDVTVAVRPPWWAAWLGDPASLGQARLNARAGPAEIYQDKSAPLDRAS